MDKLKRDVSINRILEKSLMLYLMYTIIAILCGVVFINTENNFYSMYLLVSMTFVCLMCGFACVKGKDYHDDLFKLSTRNIIFSILSILLILIIFYVTRKSNYSYSIWLDEYVQFIYGNLLERGTNISNQASAEQQPPLGYYFSALSGIMFGVNHFSVKLPSVIFSFSYFLYSPVIIFSITRSKLTSISVTIFSMLNAIMIFYSVEARAYSQALFFCLLTIFFTYRLFCKPSWRNWIFLFCTQCLFVLSVGFQPELFLIVLNCVLLLFIFSKYKESVRKYILVNISVMIFFIPYMYHIYINSIVSDKFNNSLVEKVFSEFKLFTFSDYWRYFESCGLVNYILWLAMFVGITSIIIKIVKKRNVELLEMFCLCLSIFVITFPLIFTVVFKSVVNWHFSQRYHIVFYPVLFINLGLCINVISKNISEKIGKCFSLLTILLAISLLYQRSDFEYMSDRTKRMNWKKIYQYLDSNLKEGDRVYHLTFNDIGDWRPDIFVSKEIYSSKKNWGSFIKNQRIDLMDTKSVIGRDLAENEFNGEIYFLSNVNRNNFALTQYIMENQNGFSVTNINNMLIIKIKRPQDGVNLFLDLYTNFRVNSWNLLTMEILVDYYLNLGRLRQAEEVLKNIEGLILNNKKTIEQSVQDKEKIRNDVVRYYRKLLQ